MITIQYGGWTPDLSNVAFQMSDQEGPVTVPVADCLNVFYANGTYQSLPTAVSTGLVNLAAQCSAAMTFVDTNGLTIPVFGLLNGQAYYQFSPTSVAFLFNYVSIPVLGWNFAQFGQQIFAQISATHSYQLNPGNLLYNAPGGNATGTAVSGAFYGNVLGVVGQFVMIGDLAGNEVTQLLGTGNGLSTVFNGTLTGAPIYPTSILANAGAVLGSDNGAGVISGTGITGTINYDTGAISLTFSVAPGSGVTVNADYASAYRARLQWSPIGNPTATWPTPLTNAALAVQSGINDLEYQYGPIMFIAGYPLYGVIFQRNAITRATYMGGNVVFSWQTYARNQGLITKGAAVQVGANTYFLSDSGFFYTDGSNVAPIGTAQDNSAGMDAWFFANVNKAALSTIRAGYDGNKRNVFFAIPTGSNTLPDTILCYNVIAGRWTRASQSSEMIWTDNDGTNNRLGLIQQTTHSYSLLTGTPNTGYLESCDLSFSDGNTRFTPSVRPNIACTDTPTAIVGIRNTLESSITYSAAGTADAFSAGFAPTLNQKGLYTRIRISSAAASAINGATARMRPGGPL